MAAKVAEKTGMGHLQSVKAVEAVMETIVESVSDGASVFLRGFGTFKTVIRKAKKARDINRARPSRSRRRRSRCSNPAKTSSAESANKYHQSNPGFVWGCSKHQNPMTIDDLLQEAQEIQNFLESVPDNNEDPNELAIRLTYLNNYMARSGKMLADAKMMQDSAVAAAYAEHTKSILKMPATIAQKFIASQTVNENYLVNWLDRINRTCTHQSDNIRTQISFAKEQMSLTRRGY